MYIGGDYYGEYQHQQHPSSRRNQRRGGQASSPGGTVQNWKGRPKPLGCRPSPAALAFKVGNAVEVNSGGTPGFRGAWFYGHIKEVGRRFLLLLLGC